MFYVQPLKRNERWVLYYFIGMDISKDSFVRDIGTGSISYY